MIAGMDTRPAAPAMPFRTVRRETESARMGSAMALLLLGCCTTKTDRFSRIVRTIPDHVKMPQPYRGSGCANALTFWLSAAKSAQRRGAG